jgi:hypothetical protein
LPGFFRRLRGKRTEDTGETNSDGVKTSSQKEIAIFEEQCARGIYPRFHTFLLAKAEEKK